MFEFSVSQSLEFPKGALKKKTTEARDSKQTILIEISEYDASALPFCKVQSSLGIAVVAECKIELGE